MIVSAKGKDWYTSCVKPFFDGKKKEKFQTVDQVHEVMNVMMIVTDCEDDGSFLKQIKACPSVNEAISLVRKTFE